MGVIEEIAADTGEDKEVVEKALDVQQTIKKRGITGIRFMGKAEDEMNRVGPDMAERKITKELKKKFK